MGIRKRKQVAALARPQQKPQPINSAYAAEVRRRAEKLANPVEKQKENGARVRKHQRQQAEQQMAKLRSEAVRARRLAEHIENLSQEAAAYKHKRKRTMTDTTIVDPGHAQRLKRRTDDKPAPSGNQLNFNPVHPSMELPPEQLIRLLGMESKKIRNSRKASHSPKQAAAATPMTVDTQADSTPPPAKPKPQVVRPTNRSIQYERNEPSQVFDNGRSGLLVPSLLVGLVAGIAVSGYLFWYQPADTTVQKTPTPVAVKQPQKPQSKRELVKRTPAPVPNSATKRKMSAQENAAWRAATEAQEERLRATAEQRLVERVSKPQQTTQQAELTTAPATNISPLPAPEPGIAPVNVTPEAQLETAPESGSVMQPDADILPVTPGETTAVMPAPVEATPEPEVAATGKMPDIEPATAAPEATDVEPGAHLPTEADPVLTSVTPADE
jgi:hypothetical protein